jgi:hypothetical protein
LPALDWLAEGAATSVPGTRAEVRILSRTTGLETVGCWSAPARPDDTCSIEAPITIAGATCGWLAVHRPGLPLPTEAEARQLTHWSARASAALSSGLAERRRRRQADGIERAIAAHRAQAHEHAGRLHAIGALAATRAQAEACRFVADLTAGAGGPMGQLPAGLEAGVFLGLLVAEKAAAEDRGERVAIDARSRLSPETAAALDDFWPTLIGTLFEFAVDGPHSRFTVEAHQEGDEVLLVLREPGPLWPEPLSHIHPLSETVLRDACLAAGGALTIEADPFETTVMLRLPERGRALGRQQERRFEGLAGTVPTGGCFA